MGGAHTARAGEAGEHKGRRVCGLCSCVHLESQATVRAQKAVLAGLHWWAGQMAHTHTCANRRAEEGQGGHVGAVYRAQLQGSTGQQRTRAMSGHPPTRPGNARIKRRTAFDTQFRLHAGEDSHT